MLFLLLICLASVIRGQYSTFPDLEYGESSRNTLDLYLPSSNSFLPPYPLVIYIHGGNWSYGDKSEVVNYNRLPLFTSNGIAVASMNYRYSTESVWDAQFTDFLNAVDFLSSNETIETYGVDNTRFAVWGDGEGAQIGLMGALSKENVTQYNATFQAFIAYYPVTDIYALESDRAADSLDSPGVTAEAEETFIGLERTEANEAAFDAASPSYLVENTPRGEDLNVQVFYMVHGNFDPIIPVAQTENFFQVLVAQRGFTSISMALINAEREGTEFNSNADIALLNIRGVLEVNANHELFPDISYSTGDDLLLDIYRPRFALASDRFPIIVYFHGGDWEYGDKDQVLDYNLVLEAMERKYVVVSLNFGSAPETNFESFYDNIFDALEFLTVNEAVYNLDVTKVALWGQGSGAHLAILSGLLQEVASIAPMKISAVVSWYGYTDLLNIVEDFENDLVTQEPAYLQFIPADDPASGSPMEKFIGFSLTPENEEAYVESGPMNFIESLEEGETTCDFLLITGTEDATVSPLQTLRLFKLLDEKNTSTYLSTRVVEGAAHGGAEFFNETIVSLDFVSRSFGLGEFDWEDNNEDIEEILTGGGEDSDEIGSDEDELFYGLNKIEFILTVLLVISFLVIVCLNLKLVLGKRPESEKKELAVKETA
eukprot:augustus_masked-scaffold_4-processed-gene-6.47-mRNA-1 protein AED:1.00 eAED:1.00 QI:0/-1/0/0/-1/1/1/0/656